MKKYVASFLNIPGIKVAELPCQVGVEVVVLICLMLHLL